MTIPVQYVKKTIVVFITILTSAFFAASVGLFEIPDAYFYVGLGHYLLTGEVAYVGPFNVVIQQTLFAPIYAIISVFVVSASPHINPIFFIPFLQLLLFLGSIALMTKILTKLFSKKWNLVGEFLFFLLPFQLIYAFFMMSETVSIFLSTIYLAILVLFPRKPWKPAVLVLVASQMVLTRYSLLPFLVVSLLIWVLSKPKKAASIIPAVIGIFCIASWILLHIRLYHTPLLSTFSGRHLYNNVITTGKFIPQDRSNPEVAAFFSYILPTQPIDVPWWNLQRYFIIPFQKGILTEVDIDRLFLAVSLQGIKEHPGGYLFHVAKLAFQTLNTPPYHDDVLTQVGFTEPNCNHCGIRQCRFDWLPDTCKTILNVSWPGKLFGLWIIINQAMYPVVTSVLFMLAIIGIMAICIKRQPMLMLIAGLFFIQHIFQSATEWVEGRFLLPLYPLYTILILYGIMTIAQLFSKLREQV